MTEVLKLSERRNNIVHSQYSRWRTIQGMDGLIRYNSELKAKKGIREEVEEEILPENLEVDCDRCSLALMELEKFRLKVIDWRYPDVLDQ